MTQFKIKKSIFVIFNNNLFQKKGKMYIHTILSSGLQKANNLELNNNMPSGIYYRIGNDLFQLI